MTMAVGTERARLVKGIVESFNHLGPCLGSPGAVLSSSIVMFLLFFRMSGRQGLVALTGAGSQDPTTQS